MEIELYVENLSKLTTHADLRFLFTQAGKVTEVVLSMDKESGEPMGFAYVTMSAQSGADKAVNMLNGYSLFDHEMTVSLSKPRSQHGLKDHVYPQQSTQENRRVKMINLNVNTIIYRPIKQVFDFVSKPENDFQWQYGTLGSSSLTDGTNSLGSFFRSVGHSMGRRAQGTFEVTEYEPNRKYGFRSLSGELHLQTSYTFEIANNSTKVNVSTQANLGKSSQVDERILEKRLSKQLKENMKLLKELLEEKPSNITLPS